MKSILAIAVLFTVHFSLPIPANLVMSADPAETKVRATETARTTAPVRADLPQRAHPNKQIVHQCPFEDIASNLLESREESRPARSSLCRCAPTVVGTTTRVDEPVPPGYSR
ncbi:MAG: hypothetical protein DMG49_20170 [Acidobacteria bacterium]|nr:MAG: hypothetical protein DMG49_20170 [Acidobacteriota bacterium]